MEIRLDDRTLIRASRNAEKSRQGYISHNVYMAMQELVAAGSWLIDVNSTEATRTALELIQQAKSILEKHYQELTNT